MIVWHDRIVTSHGGDRWQLLIHVLAGLQHVESLTDTLIGIIPETIDVAWKGRVGWESRIRRGCAGCRCEHRCVETHVLQVMAYRTLV